MKEHQYCVYILTNDFNTLTYIGVSGRLKGRVWEPREEIADGYTKKYHIHKLVYYETCEYIISAIAREKQLKAGSRKKKLELISSFNPEWKDLYDEI
jgi:putative endonuclease